MNSEEQAPARFSGSGSTATAESGQSNSEISVAYADNPIIRGLPKHLKQFIVDQKYDLYTPIDHAVWRYVMRQNYNFLKDTAHEAYVDGLKKTGISIETIPSIEYMNDILGKIGWAAVTVDGFIPPAAFMEFQAFRVLVIAADMRQINHIEYTPAPDIIHEAAGHAPIIADPEYAEYLRRIGEIGAKAMSSKKDFELYEAIRHLSILKEQHNADPEKIAKAEADVDYKQENLGKPSEMARLSRLHWWTVEYGLVGTLDNPKIYGAGLLSSIGESANCLKDHVKKLPYNIETADYAFDITTQQPHLFVTPNFKHLIDVLEKFADSMAFKIGGRRGLDQAIECENVSTAVYSSGLQASGVISQYLSNGASDPTYVKFSGPSMLAVDYKMLEGHGKEYHADGFSSPVGKLKGVSKPLESMSDSDLKKRKIETGRQVELEFESGISAAGRLERIVRHDGQIVLMTFTDCEVTRGDTTLFHPDWGTFDMAVGERIVSVFSGSADKDAYQQVSLVPRERTVKTEFDDKTGKLHTLYQTVRDFRENPGDVNILRGTWENLRQNHPRDWLLALEILEILKINELEADLAQEIQDYLVQKANDNQGLAKLINDGLSLLS